MPRITPACAGKRGLDEAPDEAGGDHPRVRGEELYGLAKALRSAGSPPRARGRASLHGEKDNPRRITPACAGKSNLHLRRQSWQQDHPRVRGEERTTRRRCKKQEGSPPRARGRVGIFRLNSEGYRITPACAGKSRAALLPPGGHGDHPRVRGEESVCPGRLYGIEGSPPRARGRAKCQLFFARQAGITPACAGKSRLPLQGRRE